VALQVPVEVAGRSVTVSEMTVADVRDWVTAVEAGTLPVDPAGNAAFDDVGILDIALMSDADPEWLMALAPSELAPLAEACRKVNPHFFRVRAVVQAAHIAQVRAILSGAAPQE
jgi:hypothetical protein